MASYTTMFMTSQLRADCLATGDSYIEYGIALTFLNIRRHGLVSCHVVRWLA